MTLLSSLVLLSGVLSAAPLVVYSQDFEANANGFSGSGSRQTSASMPGAGDFHWRNDAGGDSSTTLTITSLPVHLSLSIQFDLLLWDSWDSGEPFTVTKDGVTILGPVPVGNYFGPDSSCPSGCGAGPGTKLTDPFTAFASPDYGYNTGFRDSLRRVTISGLTPSSGTATFVFTIQGSQGGLDESIGYDNIIVTADLGGNGIAQIPEPATFGLGGIVLAGIALARRRYQPA